MILERIKAETRPQHEAIEKVAFSGKIMSGALTLEDYKTLIINQYIINSLMEKELEKNPEFVNYPGLDYEKRRKTDFLLKDLQHLSIDVKEIENHGYSYTFNNIHEALGAFYVLEGSTLGGSMISRQLLKNENLKAVTEYNYYGCYGDQVGPMWKSFQQVLVNAASDKDKEDIMVASAGKAFDLFGGIFEKSVAGSWK